MTLMFVTRIWGLTQSLRRHVQCIESNESVHQPYLSATVSTSACETNPESESSGQVQAQLFKTFNDIILDNLMNHRQHLCSM